MSSVSKLHLSYLMEPNGHRRMRRKDVHIQENGDQSESNAGEELDPWTAWAYKPRTISMLLIGACFLIWVSGALDPESSASGDLVSSVKRGVWAMIAVFLAYCLLQAPSTVLIRPHPAIWRLVHGMAVVYLVALTFVLFQKRDDARQFMKFLHPDLGVGNAILKPVKKVGAFCWLSVAICIVELLICIKFGHGLYPKPMPLWLAVFWMSVGTALVIFLIVWSWQLHRTLGRKRR
ncbi:PREDICTED: phosphatidylserine synthase 2-like [Fragaria vesca subsp. vesca]